MEYKSIIMMFNLNTGDWLKMPGNFEFIESLFHLL